MSDASPRAARDEHDGGGALFFGKERNVGGAGGKAAGSVEVGGVRGKGEG